MLKMLLKPNKLAYYNFTLLLLNALVAARRGMNEESSSS